jgi:glutamate-1-semialdehyde 2,1-aminomutase
LRAAASEADAPVQVASLCGLLTVFFREQPVESFEDAQAADGEAYARFFEAMLERGVYLPPSPFEAWFPSLAHGEQELERTLEAAVAAFAAARA